MIEAIAKGDEVVIGGGILGKGRSPDRAIPAYRDRLGCGSAGAARRRGAGAAQGAPSNRASGEAGDGCAAACPVPVLEVKCDREPLSGLEVRDPGGCVAGGVLYTCPISLVRRLPCRCRRARRPSRWMGRCCTRGRSAQGGRSRPISSAWTATRCAPASIRRTTSSRPGRDPEGIDS